MQTICVMFVVKDGQADGDELRSAYRVPGARSRKEKTKLPLKEDGLQLGRHDTCRRSGQINNFGPLKPIFDTLS
jgi:hypothetical protein